MVEPLSHKLPGLSRDQVQVLAQPTFGEVGTGECCAAEEHNVLCKVLREHGQQMRDEMIALHLLIGGSESLRNCCAFRVRKHHLGLLKRTVTGSSQALCGCQLIEAATVTARQKRPYCRWDVVCCISESRSVRQIEDSLFDAGYECSAKIRWQPLDIQTICCPLDEHDGGGSVP